jgi:hypothetical protein
MINTNETDYAAALRIGEEFKKLINDKYKKLEIDRDAVFERMLLLNKKKYAARKVEDDGKGGPGEITTEIKGLDMKRREYSKLSKDASKSVLLFLVSLHLPADTSSVRREVLDMILSAEATETVIEKIHEYLVNLGEAVRKGLKPLDDYIIFKVRSLALLPSPILLLISIPLTASRKEPGRLPRRQVSPSRSGRDEDESEGPVRQVGRRHSLHLLQAFLRRVTEDGAGSERSLAGRREEARVDVGYRCVACFLFLSIHLLLTTIIARRL